MSVMARNQGVVGQAMQPPAAMQEAPWTLHEASGSVRQQEPAAQSALPAQDFVQNALPVLLFCQHSKPVLHVLMLQPAPCVPSAGMQTLGPPTPSLLPGAQAGWFGKPAQSRLSWHLQTPAGLAAGAIAQAPVPSAWRRQQPSWQLRVSEHGLRQLFTPELSAAQTSGSSQPHMVSVWQALSQHAPAMQAAPALQHTPPQEFVQAQAFP
jgi:hypothetical protein